MLKFSLHPFKKSSVAIAFFYLLWSPFGRGQDSGMVNFLLQRIAAQQVRHDPYFLPGIYPSYVSKNPWFDKRKKDNNIFFNCLIAYTLNDVRRQLSAENNLLIDSMFAPDRPLYGRFKNKKRDTYNFWRTDSSFDFPFASIFNGYNKHITLPDDMDCTVLSLLALDVSDSVAANTHTLLQPFINKPQSRVKSVIGDYDGFPAYSTWLGKAFPVVFDVSVLCNILSFVQAYDLPWTGADSASLQVIIKTIEKDYHIRKPIYASPFYPTTPLVLYHIARLMNVKKIPALEVWKRKLVIDAGYELANTDNLMEKIILSTAILKMGYIPPALSLPSREEIPKQVEENDFTFFIANLPSYFSDFLRLAATSIGFGLYNYYCPAYNDALLLEYILLRNSLNG